MKIEKVHNNVRYTLSNKKLKISDKVFPIGKGRVVDNNTWVLHDLDFTISEFPKEPHTILDLNNSMAKPYEIKTDYGYGPIESYYKIVKIEKQIEKINKLKKLVSFEWIEINPNDTEKDEIKNNLSAIRCLKVAFDTVKENMKIYNNNNNTKSANFCKEVLNEYEKAIEILKKTKT